MMAFAASTATGVRNVTSSVRTPPLHQRARQRHRVFGAGNGEHRHHAGRFEQSEKLFLFRLHRETLRSVAFTAAGIAERGMMAPGWHTTTPAR